MLLHDRLLLHFCIHWDYLRLFSLTVLSQLITRVLPFFSLSSLNLLQESFHSHSLCICTTSSFNRLSSVLSTGSFTHTSTELFVDVLRLFTNLSFFLNCGKPVFLVDTLHQESYTSSPSTSYIKLVLHVLLEAFQHHQYEFFGCYHFTQQ